MVAYRVGHLAIAMGLLLFVPSFCCGDGADGQVAWRLKREAQERERQSLRAQRELAEARARVALAEGRRDRAITELRKAVACSEGEVRWIRDHANWFCDPREPMTQAQWDLARGRARLAEVEGDTATLVAECRKIVGFHEQDLQRMQRLAQMLALKSEDVCDVQAALGNARQRLEAAEKRLAAEQAKKPDPTK